MNDAFFVGVQVRLIEFSPCESYLITYSSMEPSNPREKAKVLLNVFDTKTGKKLRVFDNSVDEFAIGTAAGPGGALRWPVFKWAGGSKDLWVPPHSPVRSEDFNLAHVLVLLL